MKISLCINTFNEEKNLHIPLDSAIDLVDEVIIIDGSSKDKTVEVAKSYGGKLKVFVVDNPRNFLANKQRAIEKAGGEWILQLDADEALSEELKKEIKDILSNPKSKIQNPKQAQNSNLKNSNLFRDSNFDIRDCVGFNIPRKNWFLTRFLMKGGVYPDYVLRLYKKENAKFELKNVHENVRIGGKVGCLKNPILHYADPNFSRYLLRWDRYTTFDAEEMAKSIQYSVSGIRYFTLGLSYFIIKPVWWFLKTYFRHKGFMDGFPGFVFSLFSALRFPVIYIKWWTIAKSKIKDQTYKAKLNI